jgi:hypothetical protein
MPILYKNQLKSNDTSQFCNMKKIAFTLKSYTFNRNEQIKSHFNALGYKTSYIDVDTPYYKKEVLNSDIWIYDLFQPTLNDNLESIRDILFEFKGKFILTNMDDGGAVYVKHIKEDILNRVDAIITGVKHERGSDYAQENIYDKIVLFPRYIIPYRENRNCEKSNKIVFYGQATSQIRVEIINQFKQNYNDIFVGGITGNPHNYDINLFQELLVGPMDPSLYYYELEKYKIGLCLPGNTWWCYRHIDNMSCKNLVLTTKDKDPGNWLYKDKIQNEFIYLEDDLSNLNDILQRALNGEYDSQIEVLYNIYKNFFEINKDGSFKYSVWSEIKDSFLELGITFDENEYKDVTNKYEEWWGEPAHEERGGWWGGGHDECYNEIIKTYNVKTICEVGTYMGKSTCAFARMLPEDGKIWTIDTYKGSPEHFSLKLYTQLNNLYMTTSKNLRLDKHSHKIKLINKSSLDFDTDEKFDLIYLDGNHGEKEVIEDIKHYIKFLKSGGILSGDDMLWPSVKSAVDKCISDGIIPKLDGLYRDVIWWVKIV